MDAPCPERIAIYQKQHCRNQQEHEHPRKQIYELPAQSAPCDKFNEREHYYAAVKNRYRKQIEYRQIYAEETEESECIPYVIAHLGIKPLRNHHRTAKRLSGGLRLLGGHKSLQNAHNVHYIPLQLFERVARRHPCCRLYLIGRRKRINEIGAAGLVAFRYDSEVHFADSLTLHYELSRFAAGNLYFRLHLSPCAHRYATDRNNPIPCLHSRFMSRPICRNLANQRRNLAKLGARNDGKKKRENNRQNHIP